MQRESKLCATPDCGEPATRGCDPCGRAFCRECCREVNGGELYQCVECDEEAERDHRPAFVATSGMRGA